jgi:hypothetical protein
MLKNKHEYDQVVIYLKKDVHMDFVNNALKQGYLPMPTIASFVKRYADRKFPKWLVKNYKGNKPR